MDSAFLLPNYLDNITQLSPWWFLFTVYVENDIRNEKLSHHEFPEMDRDRLEHHLGRGGLFVYGYDETCAVL